MTLRALPRRAVLGLPAPAGCRSGRPAGSSAWTRTPSDAGPTKAASTRSRRPAATAGSSEPTWTDWSPAAGPARARWPSMGATPERLSKVYHRSYAATDASADHVRTAVADADREVYRLDGRRLVTALVAHLDADPADVGARARSEADAAELVDDLARRLAPSGTSLTESVGLFVAARRPFLAELAGLGRRRALDAGPTCRPLRGRVRVAGSAAAPADRDAPGGRLTMDPTIWLPALTSVLALVFAVLPVRPVAGAPRRVPARLGVRDAVLRGRGRRGGARRRSTAGTRRSTGPGT